MRHYNGNTSRGTHGWYVKVEGRWMLAYDITPTRVTTIGSQAELEHAKLMGKAFADAACAQYEKYNKMLRDP